MYLRMWLEKRHWMGRAEPPNRCECECCHPPEDGSATTCTDTTTHSFDAETERHCSPSMCSSKFSECPDAGAHNEHGRVEATFMDCSCACCLPGAGDSATSPCTDMTYRGLSVGSAEACTATACAVEYAGLGGVCPGHRDQQIGGVVAALYLPPPADDPAPGAAAGAEAVSLQAANCLRKSSLSRAEMAS